MRIAIEVTDAEHAAFKKYARSLPEEPTLSSVVRCFFRLALEGKIKSDLLAQALGSGRAVLNVTLEEGKAKAKPDYTPPTKREIYDIGEYLAKHPEVKKMSIVEWRERRKG